MNIYNTNIRINMQIINIKIKKYYEVIEMSKVLYIKANPKTDEISNTFKLANTFLEEYKRNNPNDEII